MQPTPHKSKKRSRLLAIIAVSFLLMASFWPRTDHRSRALAEARERWETQAADHYQLEFENISSLSLCHQLFEIQADTIIHIEAISDPRLGLGDLCKLTPTVTDLFDTIEHINAIQWCGPNGCECDGIVVADVEYDDALGYPVEVRLRLEKQADIFRRLLNRLPYNTPTCTQFGYEETIYAIRAVTPLE
jgi:hypothetical protein